MMPPHFAEHPRAYDLWQAYTLLSCVDQESPDSGSPGWTFGFPASLSFPESEVDSLRAEGDELYLDVTLPGLAGPGGPLPQPLCEAIIQERQEGNLALQEFLDLFLNRLMRLWLEDAEAMCPELGRLKEEETFFPGASYPMSAAGLEMILAKRLGIEAEVEQFRGAWVDMPEVCRTRLGGGNARLGGEAIVGKSVFDSCNGIGLIRGRF
jgi:type VI secretion system protein ImpH